MGLQSINNPEWQYKELRKQLGYNGWPMSFSDLKLSRDEYLKKYDHIKTVSSFRGSLTDKKLEEIKELFIFFQKKEKMRPEDFQIELKDKYGFETKSMKYFDIENQLILRNISRDISVIKGIVIFYLIVSIIAGLIIFINII
jgi:tetrahydromethanopterin S-methyltransferase subunit G